jgi:alpha-D-xyloside xylohydrolase
VTVTGVPGELPLFAKEDSFLPLAAPVEQVGRETVFKITVKAFGENPAPFTLVEDDGETFDFETGKLNRVVLSRKAPGEGQVERVGSYPGRRYEIVGWEFTGGPKQTDSAVPR